MPKLTILGAGSAMLTKRLLSAAFSQPALCDLEIVLEDVDEKALGAMRRLVARMEMQEGVSPRISMEMNQKRALAGADFVICAVRVGGSEARSLDRDIPGKYGVNQEIGDTLGPGGVFRGLRHIPVIVDILRDMEEVCPDALLMNYAQPLGPMVWAADRVSDATCVGLGLGVACTVLQLAGYLGLGPWIDYPYTPELFDALLHTDIPGDVDVVYGGIHQLCWILSFYYKGRDMSGEIARLPLDAGTYEADGVRCEMLKAFGYWCTENRWRMTDCVPYFSRNEVEINRFLPIRWRFKELEEGVRARDELEIAAQIRGEIPVAVRPNVLNAPKIMNAVVSGDPVRVSGNLPNRGLIDNLPEACVVETSMMVDGDGLQPEAVGVLPTQCAALCRTNINVQELVVEGALTGDREAVKHACMLDPLTASVCTLDQISDMVDELFAAEAAWLPQFSA